MTNETAASSEAPEDWAALGNRLKDIREYLNLSQQHVAAATGIPRSAVSDIERGQRKVDSLELRKFARLYRYPVGYLLGDEPRDGSAESEAVTALGRAVIGLNDADRAELLRFAEFLRFSSRGRGSDTGE